MHRVRVKIEGLTSPDDAVRVAELGADAIGMVFAESPRRVGVETAREIVAALPPWVATVGVFVDAPPDEVNDVVRRTGLQYVQLHGQETPDVVASIGARCLKAFRVREGTCQGAAEGEAGGWVDEVRRWLAGVEGVTNFAGVLLDAYDAKMAGGTGKRFNWDLVAEARAAGKMDGVDPIILAGGLNPQCVGEAVRVARPWAVDVASGAESAPGVKDFDKIAALLAAVRQAERG
jgi:phosphoribosylanthranilate isomerase